MVYGLFPLIKFLIPILVTIGVVLTIYLVIEYKWGWDRLIRQRKKKMKKRDRTDLRFSWDR